MIIVINIFETSLHTQNKNHNKIKDSRKIHWIIDLYINKTKLLYILLWMFECTMGSSVYEKS